VIPYLLLQSCSFSSHGSVSIRRVNVYLVSLLVAFRAGPSLPGCPALSPFLLLLLPAAVALPLQLPSRRWTQLANGGLSNPSHLALAIPRCVSGHLITQKCHCRWANGKNPLGDDCDFCLAAPETHYASVQDHGDRAPRWRNPNGQCDLTRYCRASRLAEPS
jgi:hypothetical protein